MTCICEACKAGRKAERKARTEKRWALRSADMVDAIWQASDGAVYICQMTDAHLFFALAKGYRGEYVNLVHQRALPALEKEAQFRLVRKWHRGQP